MSEIRANQIQNPAQDGGPVMVGLTTVQGTLDVTGLTTTQNLFVVGVTTFNSDVTIGGTLTYEDVTRVDSLGLSTFRAGLIANSVSGVSTFQRGVHLATTTGNVGIGTDVPGSILDIQGNDPTITLTDTSGTNDVATIESLSGALRFTSRDGNADGEVIFRKFDGTTQDETLRITNAGRLGIGTAAPGVQLEVFENSGSSSNLRIKNTQGFHDIQSSASELIILEGSDERLRIDTSGQVGIASANPRKTMDVSGTACMNVNDLGNVSGNVTLNFNTNNNYVMTLTGTTAFLAPTGIATGQSGVIVLKQDGTGSRTATWDSSFKFKGGTAPTLSTGAGKSDAVAYFCHEPPYIIAGTFIGIGSA